LCYGENTKGKKESTLPQLFQHMYLKQGLYASGM